MKSVALSYAFRLLLGLSSCYANHEYLRKLQGLKIQLKSNESELDLHQILLSAHNLKFLIVFQQALSDCII
jgi:hypothetical protein